MLCCLHPLHHTFVTPDEPPTDEDEDGDDDDDEARAEDASARAAHIGFLSDALVEGGALEFLYNCLRRLDEGEEDERKAVFNALSVLENLLEVRPEAVADKCASTTDLLPYLLERVTSGGSDMDSVKVSDSHCQSLNAISVDFLL